MKQREPICERVDEMAITLRLPEPPLTDKTLLALSEANPGYRFERTAEGKLIVSPTGLFTSGGEGELFAQVRAWVKTTGLGRAFPSSGGLTLPDTSIVAPDATYISNDRLSKMTPEDRESAYPRIVPNVVFELLSPTDASVEVDEKVQRYHDNGVPLVVVTDPKLQVTELCRAGSERVKTDATMVEIGPEMPGFVLDVAAVIFASRDQ
jgi:Uma2 family endonuclease